MCAAGGIGGSGPRSWADARTTSRSDRPPGLPRRFAPYGRTTSSGGPGRAYLDVVQVRLATRQCGVVSRQQLLALGRTRDEIATQRATGRLISHPPRRLRRRPRGHRRQGTHDRRPPRRRTRHGALPPHRRVPLVAHPLDAAVRRGHHHRPQAPQPPGPRRSTKPPPCETTRRHGLPTTTPQQTLAQLRSPRSRPRPRPGARPRPRPPLRRRPRRAHPQRAGGPLPRRAAPCRPPAPRRERIRRRPHGRLPVARSPRGRRDRRLADPRPPCGLRGRPRARRDARRGRLRSGPVHLAAGA